MENVVQLKGRIDTSNAPEVEREITKSLSKDVTSIVFDAQELDYISSAGLRLILTFRKKYDQIQVINCNSTVFEIFAITGFTEMMETSKAYQEISIEGCKMIGTGFYGDVYRLDDERIVKVYRYPDSLSMIKREKFLSKKAFILGIPTAIPYEIVKVGDLYGTIFELLNAKNVAELIQSDDDIVEFCKRSVGVLRQIHSTIVKHDDFPSRKKQFIAQIEGCKEYLSNEVYRRLIELADTIPEVDTLIHSDFHIKNIMQQNDELLLIDMDTLSTGHPIFEFGAMYASYVAFAAVDKENAMKFFGIPEEVCERIWRLTFENYFSDKSKEELKIIEEKIAIISFMEVLFLRSQYGNKEDSMINADIRYSVSFIENAVTKVDSLIY